MDSETVYSTLSGEAVAEVLRELRVSPSLNLNGLNEPYIRLVAKGRRCMVEFFDCAEDNRAGALQFRALFDAPQAFSEDSFIAVSQFNHDNRFLKAVIYDSGCAFLILDYTPEGGARRDHLKSAAQVWLSGLDAFETYLSNDMGISVVRHSSW